MPCGVRLEGLSSWRWNAAENRMHRMLAGYHRDRPVQNVPMSIDPPRAARALPISLAVFDMAGTTIQDTGVVPLAFDAALASHGLSATADELVAIRGAGKREAIADAADRQSKPCYDQLALMRRYPLISELLEAMEQLGWGPYQADHEDANGQFELNWTFADALTTADRHAFFRVMVRSLAERHGFSASFQPKPFRELTGNGCHLHLSLWDAAGANLFHDPGGEKGLSALAYRFLAGLLEHAPALCAITNPTPNSYERLGGSSTTSGATWSPAWISYGGNNRTHLVRIPDSHRLELRLADGDASPYLLQAAVLAAGLDGIERALDPGPRSDANLYTDPPRGSSARALPANLPAALEAFSADTLLRQALGEPFCQAYERLRWRCQTSRQLGSPEGPHG